MAGATVRQYRSVGRAGESPGRPRFLYPAVIDGIARMAWEELTGDEIMRVAEAYYYFSIQFRESLEIARARHPDDARLAELHAGECGTDNLSPWPGVASPGERMNHDEFMRRLLALHPAGGERFAAEAGLAYLAATRQVADAARAASIASYEDGGLTRVFEAMLRAPDWTGPARRAFRHFLERHISFDGDDGAGHGALSRHLDPDDRVLPLWAAFRDLLTAAAPKLAAPRPAPVALRLV